MEKEKSGLSAINESINESIASKSRVKNGIRDELIKLK